VHLAANASSRRITKLSLAAKLRRQLVAVYSSKIRAHMVSTFITYYKKIKKKKVSGWPKQEKVLGSPNQNFKKRPQNFFERLVCIIFQPHPSEPTLFNLLPIQSCKYVCVCCSPYLACSLRFCSSTSQIFIYYSHTIHVSLFSFSPPLFLFGFAQAKI